MVALSSSVAFAVLCATLASVGRIPWVEACWAAASVVLVYVPTRLWAPVGWRRRAAEATLALPAWALVMLADPIQRRMLLPPLLATAASVAVVAAWPKVPLRHRTALLALLGLSIRAAVGMGLIGFEPWRILVAAVAGGVVAWAAGRLGGLEAGVVAALLSAAIPFQAVPMWAGGAILIALMGGALGDPLARRSIGVGILPGLAGAAMIGLAVAPWGGLEIGRVFPETGLWILVVLAVGSAIARKLPAGAAGALWMIGFLTLGAALDPTPERRGFVLGGEFADVDLPAGTGDPYVLDIRIDGTLRLEPGTAVAWFRVGEQTHILRYPAHAVFRMEEGPRREGRMWRPEDVGRDARWRGSVRTVFDVPLGVVPHLTRHPNLIEGVTIALETEGAALPSAPRRMAMGWWLMAASAVVFLLQFASGTWRSTIAVVPWTILVFGSLIVRAWIEPLHLLGERFGPDLALAALLTAWLPAAVVWLRHRRVAIAVGALLVPLAAATPFLTPPLHGDEPFHLALMESVLGDGDLDLADNIDFEAHPQEASFEQEGDLLHSPVLGFLLLPGFAIAGRVGALLLLAVAGTVAVALIIRRARRLGVPDARLRFMVVVLAATYPVAVFSSQIWVEIIGVLAVSAILVATAGGRGGRWAAVALALLATAVKTRLALLVFPAALAAWWGRRRGRLTGLVVFAGAAGASAAVGWLAMGHPFGIYRRLHDLLPSNPTLAAKVVGGLAFDPAGGLLFAAPLWLVAIAGMIALWRRGGPGERMLLVGCGLTLTALLHSQEWYGGGSPPARYLVPMLPAVALAGGFLLREPRRWRRAAEILLLPSVAVWWVLVTRPHHSINPGDGSWWATDALARSYLVDTAWLTPSFLVPRPATWIVPLVVVLTAAVVVLLAKWRPSIARLLASGAMALWLFSAAGLVAAIELRTDRVVEAEAAHVRRHGGQPFPREGTFSRFAQRRGWQLFDGQSVTVPLRLAADSRVFVEGWLLGTAKRGARIEFRWNGGESLALPVWGEGETGRVEVPSVPGPGRHRLSIAVVARPHGAIVLDRVRVEERD